MVSPLAHVTAAGEVMNETGITALTGNSEEKSLRDWEELGVMLPAALGVAGDLGVISRPKMTAARTARTVETESIAGMEWVKPPEPPPAPKVMMNA